MNWKTLMVTATLGGVGLVGCNNPPVAPMCEPSGVEICGNGIDEDCEGGDEECGPPMTRTYVVSTIETALPTTDTSFGFNLDGADGMVGDATCTAAPDYVSAVTDEAGVDNQLGGAVLPTLNTLVGGEGVNGAIQEQIQGGSLLLIFEVSNINDFQNDSDVDVHIALGAVQAGATIGIDGTGLAADQTFDQEMDLGTVSGSITNGHLRAETDSLPLAFTVSDADITLTLRDVVMGGHIDATGGLTDGEFGAVVLVDDVVTIAMGIMEGLDEGLVRSVAMPDMQPVGTGEECDAISAGLGFSTVGATLEAP